MSPTFLNHLLDYITSTRLGSRLLLLPPNPPLKLVIVGLDNAGKRTLLRRIATDNNSPPTIITNTNSLETINPHPTVRGAQEWKSPKKLTIGAIDLGGGCPKSYRDACTSYIIDADAVIYMVDAADTDRMVEAMETLHIDLLRAMNGSERITKGPGGVPVLVLGNKIDDEERAGMFFFVFFCIFS